VALADAMAAVLSASPEQLDRLGEAGRQRVLERHDATREAARLAALFRRTITESEARVAADPAALHQQPATSN
jgi:glycosyltransferase involved in cell wall biosynthesis